MFIQILTGADSQHFFLLYEETYQNLRKQITLNFLAQHRIHKFNFEQVKLICKISSTSNGYW